MQTVPIGLTIISVPQSALYQIITSSKKQLNWYINDRCLWKLLFKHTKEQIEENPILLNLYMTWTGHGER